MPGLQSKWATVEPEEITKTPIIPKPEPKKKSNVTSQWADAGAPKSDSRKKTSAHSKEGNHTEHKPERPSEHRNNDKFTKNHEGRQASSKEGKKVHLPSPPQSSEKQGEMSDLAKSFASRLGVSSNAEGFSDKKPQMSTEEERKHKNRRRRSRGRPNSKGSQKEDDDASDDDHNEEDLFEDKLYEKGPMTDAAKSLASRIGVAPSEAKTKTDVSKGPKEDNEPKARYLTPKQKKLLQEKIKQEKLREEQAERERKLKEEARAMLEGLSDDDTNWADIED